MAEFLSRVVGPCRRVRRVRLASQKAQWTTKTKKRGQAQSPVNESVRVEPHGGSAMKLLKLCFVFAAALTGSAALAGQAMGTSVKKWQDFYNEGARMFQKRDAKGLASYMTPDWKSYGPDGKLRENGKVRETLTKSFAGLKSMHVQFKVLSVKGDRQTVVVHATFTFSAVTKPGADKKTHHILQKGVSDDKWILKDGKWLMAEN